MLRFFLTAIQFGALHWHMEFSLLCIINELEALLRIFVTL